MVLNVISGYKAGSPLHRTTDCLIQYRAVANAVKERAMNIVKQDTDRAEAFLREQFAGLEDTTRALVGITARRYAEDGDVKALTVMGGLWARAHRGGQLEIVKAACARFGAAATRAAFARMQSGEAA